MWAPAPSVQLQNLLSSPTQYGFAPRPLFAQKPLPAARRVRNPAKSLPSPVSTCFYFFFFRLIDSTFCFSKRILLRHCYGLQSSQRGLRLGSLPPKRRVFPNINIGGPQAIIKACIEVKPSLCNNICVPEVSWCWEGQEGAGVPEGLWQGASPPAGGTW